MEAYDCKTDPYQGDCPGPFGVMGGGGSGGTGSGGDGSGDGGNSSSCSSDESSEDSSCSGDDNSGQDNGGCDPTNPLCPDPNCDAICQLQQAEQNALQILQTNPDCANMIDGGTGMAANALNANIVSQSGVAPGLAPDLVANSIAAIGFGETSSSAIGNAGPDASGQYQITFDQLLFSAGVGDPGLFPQQNQVVAILHELWHAADAAGAPLSTPPRPDMAALGPSSVDASNMNTVDVETTCLGAGAQGDFGGNQGPVDSPPPDVPAVARPVKHHL
jgi:hypothetical protein